MHNPGWHTSRPGKHEIFSLRDTEPSSRKLPVVSGPVSPLYPGPISIPEESLRCRKSPRSFGPLFSIHLTNSKFRVQHRTSFYIWDLISEAASVYCSALIGVKIGPTSQTAEPMCKIGSRLYIMLRWHAFKCTYPYSIGYRSLLIISTSMSQFVVSGTGSSVCGF